MTTGAGASAETDAERCAASSEEAQARRARGLLREARDGFLRCSGPACPRVVRAFCERELQELEGAIPTVVIAARDARGADLAAVTVLVDGAPVAEEQRGMPIAVDPGVRMFTFEAAGHGRLEHRVVVRAGEKMRRIDVTFDDARARTSKPRGRVSPLALALGAGAAVSFAASTYLIFSAKSDERDMRATCAPTCARETYDAFDRKVIAADIALGVGVALVAGALWSILTSPGGVAAARSPPAPDAAAWGSARRPSGAWW